MKNLVIIAAIGRNREIGKNNDLIWRIKEDLHFFRNTTLGHYIVMGRKTYESMPKNLEDRKYIVLSEKPIEPQNNLICFDCVANFLKFAYTHDEDIYVIGGGTIYTQLLPFCDTMILTEIDDEEKSADTFFPTFDRAEWEIERGKQQNDCNICYQRNIFRRRERKA